MRAFASRGVPCRVLIADDDPTVRRLLADLLESLGVEHETAADGREALIALRKSGCWSAVVLDILMPRANGFEVLSRIAAREPELMRKVVVVSALTSFEERARDYGVTRFLRKPLEISRLLQHLAELQAL